MINLQLSHMEVREGEGVNLRTVGGDGGEVREGVQAVGGTLPLQLVDPPPTS